ncbi:MAG: AraC family transcriptional regulator [Chloroflexota bacterium]
MKSLPRDITEEKVRNIDSNVSFESFYAQPVDERPLATGIIRSVSPVEGLQVLGADLNGQKGYSAKVGANSALSIEFRLLGNSKSQELTGDKRSVSVNPGDILLTGSNDYSVWHVDGKPQPQFRTVTVRFSDNYLEGIFRQSPEVVGWAIKQLRSNASWKSKQTTELRCLAYQILSAIEVEKAETNLLCSVFAMKVLVCTWREHFGQGQKSIAYDMVEADELVAFAKASIQKDPHAGLTVREIAKLCRMSETAIKSLFKKTTGVSIGSFILNARMNNAFEMIRSGVSIANAAQSLGYSSPEAFSKAIKNHFGRPPSEI